MIVIYAEKADVGNKIAAALGGFTLPGGKEINYKNRAANEDAIKRLQRSQGYLDTTFQGKPCCVTWGYGHLYALQDVPAYDPAYKSWRARPVCFIPEKFKLQPTKGSTESFTKTLDRQRNIVKDLFKKAEYVINATDYDREGELIFAYVCEACGYHKPFYRVLFTSQTEEGIQKAFDHLIDSKDVRNIEYAGRARSIYDWLIGMNMSTQMTLRFPGNNVLSIGRVQTPVLKMLVDREEAIAAFVPKFSWNIKGIFQVETKSYSGVYKGNGEMTKPDADSILTAIYGQPGTVTKLEKKKSKREVPLLYSQTSLQIDASKYFGYTAKETLDAAQFLYENGYSSYPRTKSQHLTDDMVPEVVHTLNKLAAVPDYAKYLAGKALSPAAKFFDSSKVISHFAIIPTGEIPKKLTAAQKNVYDLIVWSLIRTIYPDAIIEKTSVVTTVDGRYDFQSNGTTIVDPGWLAVNVKTKETILPALTMGTSYPGTYEGKETKTEPPKRYDDGSLVKAMKTAGKDLDDAEFRAILADPDVEGIGTDATRAEIIETLLRRGYIERKGKTFYATQKGIDLIHNIPVPDMMSPEFTARMEQNLSKIEKGTLPYPDFLEQVYEQTRDWSSQIAKCKGNGGLTTTGTSKRVSLTAPTFGDDDGGFVPVKKRTSTTKKKSGTTTKKTAAASSDMECPMCGNKILRGPKGWYCSNHECKFQIYGTILSHELTDKEVTALLEKGQTSVIRDFVSRKTGKSFSARLTLDSVSGNINFAFENTRR